MSETTSTPVAPIFGDHLIRAASKAVPILGDVITEMTLNVAKDLKDAESKKHLFELLEGINQHQQAHDTDLGDLLLQARQNMALTESVRDALGDIAALFQGKAAPETKLRIEQAAGVALKGYAAVALANAEISNTTINRYALSKAIEGQLEPEQFNQILDDLPSARKRISPVLGMDEQISKLLNFEASIEGEGLNNLLAVIVRRYPKFKLNP